jgi:hypothetical protein
LDEITEKTEKRRAEDEKRRAEEEERRLELEEKKRKDKVEKDRAAEIKAEEKHARGMLINCVLMQSHTNTL